MIQLLAAFPSTLLICTLSLWTRWMTHLPPGCPSKSAVSTKRTSSRKPSLDCSSSPAQRSHCCLWGVVTGTVKRWSRAERIHGPYVIPSRLHPRTRRASVWGTEGTKTEAGALGGCRNSRGKDVTAPGPRAVLWRGCSASAYTWNAELSGFAGGSEEGETEDSRTSPSL